MEQNGSTLAWIGGAPARVRVDRVRIDFAHTRTILRAVRVVIDEVTTEFELEGFSASVTLDPVLVGTGESDQVRVEVDFEGEAPRPMAVLVNGDKSLPIPDWLPAGLVVEDRPPEPVLMRLYKLEVDRRAVRAESVRVDSVAAPDTSSAEVFKQRKLAIERDALVKQAFFAHDFATNPGLDLGRWQAGMADLNAHLGDRVQFYSAFATNHASFPDYGPVDEPYLGQAVEVSKGFRIAFEGLAAQDSGGATSEELFDWAFEHFVTSGVLTRHNDLDWQAVLMSHGTPNSTYYLRFALFAVLCLESNVDAAFWRPRLRTLVRTAHMFLESAAPLKADPFPSEEHEFEFFPDRYFPRSRRRELRDEYAGIGAGADPDGALDALRARLGSLIGKAIALPAALGGTLARKPIPIELRATLLAQGVSDEAPSNTLIDD